MPKPHSEQTKAQARQLYEQRGAAHAAEQLSVPIRTIRYWANSAGWTHRLAAVAHGPDLGSRQQIGWTLRRRGLADEMGAAATEALTFLRERVRDRKVYGTRDLAVAVSTLTERADALVKAAGGGFDEPDVPAEAKTARLVELVDVAEQREASGG